jgi:hypothetical protein
MSGNARIGSDDDAARLLAALGEQLGVLGERIELVVVGGTALLALGLGSRVTRDIDVVALIIGGRLSSSEPFPPPLAQASERVARDFRLPRDWINSGPADMVEELPDGFDGRLETRHYGPNLTVHFASRFDQIHFKFYAAADGMSAKHEVDLRNLAPTEHELRSAARWSLAQNAPGPFETQVAETLRRFGVQDARLDP